MHWNEGALHPGELVLELLLGRVHHHLGALAEQEFLHLDEPVEVAGVDLAGVDLVDLPLVEENDSL